MNLFLYSDVRRNILQLVQVAYLLLSVDWTGLFFPVLIIGRPDISHGKGLVVKNCNRNLPTVKCLYKKNMSPNFSVRMEMRINEW